MILLIQYCYTQTELRGDTGDGQQSKVGGFSVLWNPGTASQDTFFFFFSCSRSIWELLAMLQGHIKMQAHLLKGGKQRFLAVRCRGEVSETTHL